MAYAVVAWLLIQVATQVFPFLEIPNWVVRLVIMMITIGFPIALIIAWAFEATLEGIKRTEIADAMPTAAGQKKHAWIYIVVIGAAISVVLFFVGRYSAGNKTAAGVPNELPTKSIAVLPFDNLSGDPDNAYFAEGVQDEILTRLAKVADLKVISRTSTQRFKSAPSDLRDIAKQLGVSVRTLCRPSGASQLTVACAVARPPSSAGASTARMRPAAMTPTRFASVSASSR